MSDYGIDVFNFEFWEGPPPAVPTRQVQVTRTPGVDGVAEQLLGTWGETFQVSLTSHWATFLAAIQGHALMINLIGTGGKFVKFDNVNWSSMYGVLYYVDSVELVDLHAALWLIGPGYIYGNGASLTTRWTLTPQKV
jgi:hypothetical protein